MAKLELWPEVTPTLMYLYLDSSISGGQLPGNLSAILPKLTTFSCFGCNLEVTQLLIWICWLTGAAAWELKHVAGCRGQFHQVQGGRSITCYTGRPGTDMVMLQSGQSERMPSPTWAG